MQDAQISFTPAQQGQQIALGEQMTFAVVLSEADTAAVNWERGGFTVGQALSYDYVPDHLGLDTLRVFARAGDVARNYYWVITVGPGSTTLPPPVTGISAEAGPEAGEVLVSWARVTPTTYPIDEYVVAVSFDGPISAANWDAATELGRVPYRAGAVRPQDVYGAADGMIPGAAVWFAVRAVDTLDQLSPIVGNGYTVVTTGWWLSGTVLDDTDAELPGIVVSLVDPVRSTNTDLNGRFRIGPLRSIDRVVLRTTSSSENGFGWYDYTSAELDSVSGRDLVVRLIKRHELDDACNGYSQQFLTFLREMSITEYVATDPQSSVLHVWDDFPLRVHIPDVVVGEVDFGAAMRFAMAYWDSVMGESYFVETTDPAQAQLQCRFDESISGVYGRVSLLQPGGGTLGSVPLEKLQVFILSTIGTEKFARTVSLHELGHTLGLYNHVACGGGEYLMFEGLAGDTLDRLDPINPNERQAVQCLRRLPTGTDMRRYAIAN
ncbi:carboxypeptidase regulatory-like domain-containing protein [bacterium]|nr:carboxypeptidase regulatory-like domain-containing protein [bacterium]